MEDFRVKAGISDKKLVNRYTASCKLPERKSSGIGALKAVSKQLNCSSRVAPSATADNSKSHISLAIFEYATLQNK
jgi:hypothetical protein